MKTLKLSILSAIMTLCCIAYISAQENSNTSKNPENSEKIKKQAPLKNSDEVNISNEKGKTDFNSTELLKSLFKKNEINGFDLSPNLFKAVLKDEDLIGTKVLFKKENKIYKYLGNQDHILELLNSSSFKENQCTDCTTRTCESGTVYTCGCYKGWCLCPLCADIVKLKEIPVN